MLLRERTKEKKAGQKNNKQSNRSFKPTLFRVEMEGGKKTGRVKKLNNVF